MNKPESTGGEVRLERTVRRGIWHMECCAFREAEGGKECDCGCMEAMDALNRLVAERDHYREGLELFRDANGSITPVLRDIARQYLGSA